MITAARHLKLRIRKEASRKIGKSKILIEIKSNVKKSKLQHFELLFRH